MDTGNEDLEFMRHPGRWPASFSLPLVKRGDPSRKPGEMPQAGFLAQPSIAIPTPEPKPVVYLVNIWDEEALKGKKLSELPKAEYDSLMALVEDGWEVD
jgi:hypothetical protein